MPKQKSKRATKLNKEKNQRRNSNKEQQQQQQQLTSNYQLPTLWYHTRVACFIVAAAALCVAPAPNNRLPLPQTLRLREREN